MVRRSLWVFKVMQEGKEHHVIMKKILGCVFGGLCDFELISVFRLSFLVFRIGE